MTKKQKGFLIILYILTQVCIYLAFTKYSTIFAMNMPFIVFFGFILGITINIIGVLLLITTGLLYFWTNILGK